MKIIKSDFAAGAEAAEGIAVIIDVFRAFSTACYCLHGLAARLLPAGSIEEALALRRRLPDAVLIGERGGRKIEGFDFGNSPTEVQTADLKGKNVIQTTHAGTQGLVKAMKADEVLTGAFVNAKATARCILSRSPKVVTLVRMGWQAETPSDEDSLCADYLECLLTGAAFDEASVWPLLRASPCSSRFFDPAKPWSPSTDFDLCLKLNCFDFALTARTSPEDGLLSLCKIEA
ncbi:2-phosphosulfolactate phosphatase [Candidatus Electronema sp. JC]|uniref:2-phosphosulfolactate phosphatase n=1 Tax=Candidatus Electronema sp. JC TaxID=3401570 RepID=UPI003B42E2B9